MIALHVVAWHDSLIRVKGFILGLCDDGTLTHKERVSNGRILSPEMIITQLMGQPFLW